MPALRSLPRRVRKVTSPVTVTLDGEAIVAERGEPLAAAFLAAGKTTLARSPKFHRPRGPSCFRGACDGCLARVDDAPNVMTCMVAADDGMEVVTQNRLGPREADLLRMTDWFFPEGMNHHELFAGIPGVQGVMQAFARRVAGLGKLPVSSVGPRKAARRTIDVLVVGAGPSGMAVATRLARAGRDVEILDDQLAPGGGIAALAPEDAESFASLRADFERETARKTVRMRTSTTAAGLYGRDLLVVGEGGAEIVEARALVLACGAHDGQLAFEGNDLPGVMSARAAGWLLARGILVGREIALFVAQGGGPFGASFVRAVAALPTEHRPNVTRLSGAPTGVRGTTRPKSVEFLGEGGPREIRADAVLVDAPRAPAYELAAQAGASLEREDRGFVVRTTAGRVGSGIFACGELTGIPFDAAAIGQDAERVSRAVQDADGR